MANEKVKKPEPTRIPILVNPYPEWTGRTVISNKYGPIILEDGAIVTASEFTKLGEDDPEVKATQVRLEVRLPVPSTSEEAKELYNLAITDLAIKGVVQHCYGERVVTPMLQNAAESGIDMGSEEFIAKVESEIREALVYEEKETKASQAKQDKEKLNTVYAELGLKPDASVEEFQAALAAKLAELKQD